MFLSRFCWDDEKAGFKFKSKNIINVIIEDNIIKLFFFIILLYYNLLWNIFKRILKMSKNDYIFVTYIPT